MLFIGLLIGTFFGAGLVNKGAPSQRQAFYNDCRKFAEPEECSEKTLKKYPLEGVKNED